MIHLDGISTIVIDIEGTICPISFVKGVLYPYALSILPHTLSEQWTDPSFQPYLSAFPAAHKSSEAALLQHVTALSESDTKDPALKQLQGYLWRLGYESGELSTPLFDDVVPTLKEWVGQGKKLVVFSSGSVEAQRMFFRYVGVEASEDGKKSTEDLSSLFVANFDTMNAGPKMETSSYVRIASEVKEFADEVLFLSDNVSEIRAALDASMKAIVVDRPGNTPLSVEDRKQLKIVSSLDEIELGPGKKVEAGSSKKTEGSPTKPTERKAKRKVESEVDTSNLRRSKRISDQATAEAEKR